MKRSKQQGDYCIKIDVIGKGTGTVALQLAWSVLLLLSLRL